MDDIRRHISPRKSLGIVGERLSDEQLKGSVKEPSKFHNYQTEKITRKASDTAEYIELLGFSTRDRHAWRINVILWTSADICGGCSRLEYVDIRLVY